MEVSSLLLLGLNGVISPVFALNNSLNSMFQIFHTQKRALWHHGNNTRIKIHIRKSTHPYKHVFFTLKHFDPS